MRLSLALLLAALALATLPPGSALADPLDVLGSYDPGSPGFNATAVGLDGIAYLGSWGFAAQCPGLGVRLIDVQDPTAPRPLGSAAAYQGTTAEHVAVAHLATPSFTGTVLFAGIQRCQPGGGASGGLAIWDVTDPTNPQELAFFVTGRRSQGVHEFALLQQGRRWLALLAVPNSEVSDGQGDLRIVDVTDPYQPTQLVDWGARKDAGLPIGRNQECAPYCRGASPEVFLHSVSTSADGWSAYLSYWDLGVITLDITEPDAPRLAGWFTEPLGDEGNTHSVAIAPGGRLMFVADETDSPPWGFLRLVDISNPSAPAQVGTFQTADGAAGTHGEPYAYSIHNPLPDDRDPAHLYLAWYADGVRLLDVSNPAAPTEIASWLPPHQGMIWNVAFMSDLLLAGDIENGLVILRR